MALMCHHVVLAADQYWSRSCEYEIHSDRLLRWANIPYKKMFERIDEDQSAWLVRVILRCYKGAAAVR